MSVDPWTPAQGRLPDLWVTTPSPACSSTLPSPVLLLQLSPTNTSVSNLSHFNPSLLEGIYFPDGAITDITADDEEVKTAVSTKVENEDYQFFKNIP